MQFLAFFQLVILLFCCRYHLRAVCETDSDSCTLEEKSAFMRETRHAFGRTALLLSGGAALGAFHLGVVRTLIEQRLLPRVVAGASVGSIICSFAATRTWTELQSFFDDPMPPMHFFENMGSIFATAYRLVTRGAVHEIGSLQRKMRQLIGDLTFQEAYDLSGRVLGVSVCSARRLEPPRCLNYLTSPHVVIWSAVTASCAFPGLFEAQELMAKDRTGHLVPYHTPPQVCPYFTFYQMLFCRVPSFCFPSFLVFCKLGSVGDSESSQKSVWFLIFGHLVVCVIPSVTV